MAMTKYACAALMLLACPALAASPEGEWRVKDGTAHIRVLNCGGPLWGIISWTKEPGTDEHNPNPAKRNRPILGLPILRGMKSEGNGDWRGDIYNADNGKTYHGSIRLVSDNVLRVEGCVLGGIFCGGENWTRLAVPRAEENDVELCHGMGKD